MIQDKKSKKSQYCNKLQGWGIDLATNWILHINVQCPLGSYLSLPLYLMLELWILLILETILCTFTCTSKQHSSALSHFSHCTLHISLQSVCDIWIWGQISENTLILFSIVFLREREIKCIKHMQRKYSKGRRWTQKISG